MNENKGRYSKQRETIYQILCDNMTHPTVDEIYMKARQIIPDISLGTVYRNLNVLVEQGRIRRVDIGDKAHYDAKITKHYHFVCKDCGDISDMYIDDEMLKDFISNVEEKTGNKLESVDIIFNGVCSHCHKE